MCGQRDPPRDALEGKGPQRRPQWRLGRRLEEVAKAVGGGYCRLQMPLKLALGVRGTVAGHRLGALEGGGGGFPPANAFHGPSGASCLRPRGAPTPVSCLCPPRGASTGLRLGGTVFFGGGGGQRQFEPDLPKITVKQVVFCVQPFSLSNFRGHQVLLLGPPTGAWSEGWLWEPGSKEPHFRSRDGLRCGRPFRV